jgi:hypothetical protein
LIHAAHPEVLRHQRLRHHVPRPQLDH